MSKHDDWSADEREQLEIELLELHFGCHENPEAIEARLEREPRLRELQRQVIAGANVLEEAVRPEQPRLPLKHDVAANARAARRPRWFHLPLGRLSVAAAAAAVFLLGFLAYERVVDWRWKGYLDEHLHLTVSAPKAVPAGAPWSFTVQAQDLQGEPVACKVRWQAFDDNGAALAADEAAVVDGNATVSLPAALQVPRRVEVVASHANDEVRQVFELSTAMAGPLVHLTTDRPVYRPGEPVFVRAVVLDRVTRLPLQRPLQISAQLLDAKGAPVGSDHEQAAPGGVGSFRLQVPPQSQGGTHKVQITSNNGSFAPETVEVVVRAFRNPQLKKDIVLDRKSYAPGQRGSARVAVTRLANDSKASGGMARGALVVDGDEVWSEELSLDANGEALFRFRIPDDVEKGAARFVATIRDSGHTETEVEPFVVPTGEVLCAAFPEGGELIADVENGLYLECSDPLGRPVDTSGELLDARGQRVLDFRTAHQGRVKIGFVPRAGERYRVRLVGDAKTHELPTVQERGVALRLLTERAPAGQPLRIAAAGRGHGPWVLGVFCRGVMVGQTTLRAADDGELRAVAEVELPDSACGVLRATVFDRDLRPIAERLVQREATHKLDVAIAAAKRVATPGETQTVTVTTTDENGSPRRALVGLRCTDEAATSMGSEPRVGLADHAMLFADVERTEDLGDFFLAHAGGAQNADLLLGTRGWRRFVWRNDDAAKAAIAQQGDAAADVLTREGFSQTPQVRSNLQAAKAPAIPLANAAHRAGRSLQSYAALALALMIGLLLVEGLAALLRRGAATKWMQGVPVAAGLVVVLAGGLLFAVQANIVTEAAPAAMVVAGLEVEEDFDGVAEFDQLAAMPDPGAVNVRLAMDQARLFVNENEWNFELGAVPQRLPFNLGAGGWDDTVIDLNGFAVGAGNIANERWPLAGAFFMDGEDGDAMARRENLFAAIDVVRRFQADDEAANPVYLAFDEFDNAGLWLGQQLQWRPQLIDAATRETLVAGYLANWQTTWQQRQYAHQHQPSDERRDFTATVYWNTMLVTDEHGMATTSFATSDAATTWKLEADAHVAKGDTGRVGQGEVTFTTQLPLQIEPKLPVEVSAGDHLDIPVACTLQDAKEGEVTLQVRVGDGLRLGADAPTKLLLEKLEGTTTGVGRALLPIDVDTTVGDATIEITARAGRFVDTVRHVVHIAPRGFPHQRSTGGTITVAEPAEWRLTIPDVSVEGSGHVTLKVYPSPVAALTEGLEGILREPHGCFEQASSSNYPNTLVLNLIEANGDDVPAVSARARDLLPRGYAKITGYECKQKGYEWFGADPGHEALTAYGLLQFHDMANVYDVDLDMVERTKQWLLGRRDGEGSYRLNQRALDHFGGASERITAAYVTFALLQTGTDKGELTKELDLLASRVTTEDPYELALIACALQLGERPEAPMARRALAAMQADDGSLPGAKSSITRSGGQDLIVETTGFAVLAWLQHGEFAGDVREAIEYLQSSRRGSGTFGATQATICALKAITAYATHNRTMREDGTLKVYEQDRLLAEHAFLAGDVGAIELELWNELGPGEHALRMVVEGGGESALPWSGEVRYHAETPANDPDAAVSIATSLRKQSVVEGETVALDVTMHNVTDEVLPTPIAIIGLPAGLELPTKVLEDLQDAERFAYWELRGRDLILYWRELDPGQRCELTLDLVARIPGTSSGSASRGYLYYTPDQKHWAAPLQVEVRAE